jgi:hypothetical protein
VTAHTKVFQVIEGRNIPDWKKFLYVKENKQALINFFGDFIVKFNQSNEHLCMGSHFGMTSLSADLMEFFPSFLRYIGQIHLLLYVLLQSMMSTVCSSR